MVKLIGEILRHAKEKRATDIHLAAGSVPRIRHDGQLLTTPFKKILPEDTAKVIDFIMNNEQKTVLKEKQYLSFPVTMDLAGRVRVNVFKQRGSFSINFRLLDKEIPPLEKLGIPDTVMDICRLKSGLVLVCGNRKTGKSTTIGTIINKIVKTRESHIITIEDPIEYLYKHDKSIVNQKEVGLDVENFREGIYSAMCQDPDVIMVSYSENPEIFSAALSAAENGYLVLTSLRISGAVKTIEHIIGMYPEEQRSYIKMQLGSVLKAIITQQLIPSKDEKDLMLASEIVIATDAIKNLIMENKSHQIPSVVKASKSLGMVTMEDSISELYAKGLISKESVMTYKQNS